MELFPTLEIGWLNGWILLVLIILTPLKIQAWFFIPGLILYVLGVVGLVVAMLNFKDTALNQPVTKGVYKISRHPQIVAQFTFLLGICLAIGSWAAVFTLLMSRILQHFSILAEEEVCIKEYGDPYRNCMESVPRYFLFF